MYVAVYGSLKRGFHNHQHYMNPQAFRFVGIFVSVPKFHMVSLGGYPAVSKDHALHHIKAEVYEVLDQAQLSHLDRLEGHPNWYNREPVDWYKDSPNACEIVQAQMYMMAKSPDSIRYQGVRVTDNVAEWVRTHD